MRTAPFPPRRAICQRRLHGLLEDYGIAISISRKANPWDNAACASFMKTLKYEEVYRTEYRNIAHARAAIGKFLEKVYNEKRLHFEPGLPLARAV